AKIKQFGWMLLALTIGVNALIAVLGELFAGRKAIIRWLLGLAAGTAIAIVFYHGLHRIMEIASAPRSWTEAVAIALALALGALLMWLSGRRLTQRKSRNARSALCDVE